MTNKFFNFRNDLPSSIVVFFVALPLCLGIALASGAPLFSGLIAGIIGGIVVGAISGSNTGVSGPAAGLAAIVLTAIGSLGGYENFLLAVVIGGIIQFVFGLLKAGVIGYYFPTSVIKGMLTGIGLIIFIKQIPIFFGYIPNEGDVEYGFFELFNNIDFGSTLVGFFGLTILLVWEIILIKKHKIFQMIQGPLVAVVVGIIFFIITKNNSAFSIDNSFLVNVPVPKDFNSFLGQFTFPNFSAISNPQIWVVAFTIALVASLETLLCVEATDKIDPEKNITPTNRELLAQGSGNILSGLIGGLPVTQVIVRSSANIQSGAKTKASAIIHGFFLLISVMVIPDLLNMIPLSVLAAILFIVGYKLAKPKLFLEMYKLGWEQFFPFIITVIGIVFIDLLYGIGLGLSLGVLIVMYKNYQNSHVTEKYKSENKVTKITLAEEVTFINKSSIYNELMSQDENTLIELDLSKVRYIDHDIIEIFNEFISKAIEKNIEIKVKTRNQEFTNPNKFDNIVKQ